MLPVRTYPPASAGPRPRFSLWLGLTLATVWLLMSAATASAVSAGALDPSQTYHVTAIQFSGNRSFSANDLEAVMATKTRPFYALWQKRPTFDPAAFSNDLNQLKLFYQAHGYYDAQIRSDLTVKGSDITPHITIEEGQTVRVGSIAVDVTGPAPPPSALQPGFKLPLRQGQIFTQPKYQLGQQNLIAVYHQNGYAHAEVNRHAVVRTGPLQAQVSYRVTPGMRGIFGTTTVSGTHKVDPKIILREL